jgi:hypothetical protein
MGRTATERRNEARATMLMLARDGRRVLLDSRDLGVIIDCMAAPRWLD